MKHRSENWLLPYLAAIRIRPGTYLGTEKLEGLYLYVTGYADARADLGAPRFGQAEGTLLDEFAAWLGDKLDRGRNLDWRLLVELVDNSERNVTTFYALFDEFLSAKGIEWPMADAEKLRHEWARTGPA